MSTLNEAYRREYQWVREQAQQFAATQGPVAARLGLNDIHQADPHVEQLLQGFASLVAQCRQEWQVAIPDLARCLVEEIQPQVLQPVAAQSVMQLSTPYGVFSVPQHTPFRSDTGRHFRTQSTCVVTSLQVNTEIYANAWKIILTAEDSIDNLALADLSWYCHADTLTAERTVYALTQQDAELEWAGQTLPVQWRFQVSDARQSMINYFHAPALLPFLTLHTDAIISLQAGESMTIHGVGAEFMPAVEYLLLHCVGVSNHYQTMTDPLRVDVLKSHYRLGLSTEQKIISIDAVQAKADDGSQWCYYPLTQQYNAPEQTALYHYLGDQRIVLHPGKPLVSHTVSCTVSICDSDQHWSQWHNESYACLLETLPSYVEGFTLIKPCRFLSPQQDSVNQFLRSQAIAAQPWWEDDNLQERLVQLCQFNQASLWSWNITITDCQRRGVIKRGEMISVFVVSLSIQQHRLIDESQATMFVMILKSLLQPWCEWGCELELQCEFFDQAWKVTC